MADQTGIEPAIFSVTGRHVNRYTTDPSILAEQERFELSHQVTPVYVLSRDTSSAS